MTHNAACDWWWRSLTPEQRAEYLTRHGQEVVSPDDHPDLPLMETGTYVVPICDPCIDATEAERDLGPTTSEEE